jgi:hypothetical protein
MRYLASRMESKKALTPLVKRVIMRARSLPVEKI